MFIENKVYTNFYMEDERDKVIIQIIDDEAKIIFNKRSKEIAVDQEFDRIKPTLTQMTDNQYTAHVATDNYKKVVRASCLDAIRDMVFGTGKSRRYAYVFEKRYMRECEFISINNKVKDY